MDKNGKSNLTICLTVQLTVIIPLLNVYAVLLLVSGWLFNAAFLMVIYNATHKAGYMKESKMRSKFYNF